MISKLRYLIVSCLRKFEDEMKEYLIGWIIFYNIIYIMVNLVYINDFLYFIIIYKGLLLR